MLTLTAAAAVSLAVPAATGATAPSATPAATPPTTLKVRSCEVGSTARERTATFYARMRAVPGTSRMLMRFTLIDHSSRGSSVVPVAGLKQWRRSRTGVAKFGYAQKVAGLRSGGSYAAQVEFRWIGSSGRMIRSLKRTSADCRQDGDLPNLAVTRIAAQPGDSNGTELYSVDVTNRGTADVDSTLVDLFVDGAALDSQTLAVKAGETRTVHISGPVCSERVRAVVDRTRAVPETTEDDNVVQSRCPSVSPQ